MGNAFGAGLDSEASRGRDVTTRDRRIEESHIRRKHKMLTIATDDPGVLQSVFHAGWLCKTAERIDVLG